MEWKYLLYGARVAVWQETEKEKQLRADSKTEHIPEYRKYRKHLKGGSYSGVPKFIVETLSPAMALRDKTVKKEIYQNAGVAVYWIISSRERAVEIYYLEDGKYELKYSYILQDDAEEAHYNADTKIVLKEFPHISMILAEIFENVD